MAKTIKVDQLSAEMAQIIKEYTEDMSEKITRQVDETAKNVLEETERLAPVQTGNYADSFKISKQNYYNRTKRIIWTPKYYMLVHLLEFGHALWQGGRSPAIPHLRPAYEKYGRKLPDDIKKIIRRG